MQEIIPFAFEERLVRAVRRDGEPWFVGRDVCECLAIKNHNAALSGLDSDEKGVASSDPLSVGGQQSVAVISEPGVYRLVFRSRKPEAERFKRWLAHDVLPVLRRSGSYVPAVTEQPAAEAAVRRPEDALLTRLQVVREARMLFGAARARVLWRDLGLPALPPPPMTAADEARVCLRHLLDAPAHEGGPRIRDLLEPALDDDENARALLVGAGIKPLPERDAFVVANSHAWIATLFARTDWSHGRHIRVLRRLPGIAATGPSRLQGLMRRGSLVPAEYLDEGLH